MTTTDPTAIDIPREKFVEYGVIGAAILAAGVLYWPAIVNLFVRWGGQDELSHSYFIPVISAWLVWSNRENVVKSIGAPSMLGVAIVGASLLLLLLGKITHIFVLQHLALVATIAGGVAGFGGLSLLRMVAAPVVFLLFAVPPPFWVITVLSWNFQEMSSILGVAMLEAMSVPVFLSGNIIDLGNYKLQVAEACSGLRYLFPFLSIGVMAAYMFNGPLWQRLTIVAATVPITIVMNSFRIAVTGVFVANYGPEHAEGALHFFEGWVVFLFCLVALFGVVAALCWFAKPRRNPLDALMVPEIPAATPSPARPRLPQDPKVVFAGLAVAALAFIGLGKVITTDSLIVPDRERFVSLPSQFPTDWRSNVLPIDPEIAEVLGADDSIIFNLTNPEAEFYNIYIAYLDRQRDGRSWHSPRQCIPGGGWKILSREILPATTADGQSYFYNRMLIENKALQSQQLVYYWYDQRGRRVANEFVMKFWLIFDAVFKKRSDGAMVRVMTPVPSDAPISVADERLKTLTARMDGFIADYVPN